MLSKLETIKNYRQGLFGVDKDWWEGYTKYRWICDLCGREIIFNVRCYDYNGYASDWWIVDAPKTLTIGYGKYNKREISICPTHTDTEIENKLESLKD